MDPEIAAREMRRERDSNGERLFSNSEFLTPGPVSSFFSRLAAKIRKQPVGEPFEEDDLAAVTEEENFVTTRESVLAALQLVHPIICDQQNVCEMVKAGSLAKQKLLFIFTACVTQLFRLICRCLPGKPGSSLIYTDKIMGRELHLNGYVGA